MDGFPDLTGLQLSRETAADIIDIAMIQENSWAYHESKLAGEIVAYVNGRIPSSALRSIPGGHLEATAASRWMAMRSYIGARHGVWIAPLGPNSSYRPYATQQYYWSLYRSGRGNVAAVPGTSNHGWGRAVDVATPTMAALIIRYGAQFGWNHAEGARVGEWWHMTYVGGGSAVVTKPKPNPLAVLSKDERHHVDLLLHWRAEMVRQARSGKGPKWHTALERARDQKAWCSKRRDRLWRLYKAPGGKKYNRGSRRKVLAQIVAGQTPKL